MVEDYIKNLLLHYEFENCRVYETKSGVRKDPDSDRERFYPMGFGMNQFWYETESYTILRV